LPPLYVSGGWLGREFWVQQPQTLGTNPGSTIGAPLAPGESFINVAALGSTAFFADWTQVADSSGSSVIHVYDVGVVPSVKGGASADYDVQVIDRDCGQMREADFSLPLPLTNCVWGDITGPFFNGRPTECDGVIDTRDIVTEIDAFSGKAAGPPKQKADLLRNGLNPGVVDGVIDFVGEVTRVVDAATGAGYPPSFFAPPP
ncbi:MAG: hypothetical protein ACE5EX_04790, partial [Phycisphaerae bacterium]